MLVVGDAPRRSCAAVFLPSSARAEHALGDRGDRGPARRAGVLHRATTSTTLYATDYEVHFNSDRTGVRLDRPAAATGRATDGGEAGLHPSNIHDNAYSIGALDFTGDTPILLGPDGPSLGGFVCPVTVVAADRWKLGQLAPGNTVRFVPVRSEHAASRRDLGVCAPRGHLARRPVGRR